MVVTAAVITVGVRVGLARGVGLLVLRLLSGGRLAGLLGRLVLVLVLGRFLVGGLSSLLGCLGVGPVSCEGTPGAIGPRGDIGPKDPLARHRGSG